MPKKLRKKYFAMAMIFGFIPLLNLLVLVGPPPVIASTCPDVELIFARGSGAEQYSDRNYVALKTALESKLESTGLNYRSMDLSYPATAVGFGNIENILVSLGAIISGGESYEFGRSVAQGTQQMANLVNSNTCPNTKYVLAGYSQGAIVVDKALKRIDSNRILYATTFGDPKLYLPEGKGLIPAACRGQNLSDYRMYVPECHAYQGLLGGYVPYRPENYVGKVGTWCNAHDIMCSSRFNVEDHSSYVRSGLYEDASRVMYAKIVEHFGLNQKYITPHDTAILIDSTSSMTQHIEQFKKQAIRLAKETLNSGGRVALYDYRDLAEKYNPVEHCNFETCTIESFQSALDQLVTESGGDRDESLLAASMHVMQTLKWRRGATKSLVILTDAGYHTPDFDGTRMNDVVALSKKIDPVNFYIITQESEFINYASLANHTDGKVVSFSDDLDLLTDYIMERYDTLPRVEEISDVMVQPNLTINQVERIDETSARVKYTSDAAKAMVFLNDAFLGITDQTELVVTDLRPEYENNLTLVPITDSVRGEAVTAKINDGRSFDDMLDDMLDDGDTPTASEADSVTNSEMTSTSSSGFASKDIASHSIVLPKAPNTGKV